MSQKANIISNTVICLVLAVLSVFVFTADLSETFVDITAPLYSGNIYSKSVSVMFTVEENAAADDVRSITLSLQNARSSATFFVSGGWVGKNIELTKELAKKYELGNYGFSGAKLNLGDIEKIKNEIKNTHNIVSSVADYKMKFLTPPEQKYNKNTLSAAESLGYTTVLPTQKNGDKYNGGDLILLSVNRKNADDLDRIISNILSQNFHIVCVGDNMV
jgi:hypothetical protein